MKIPLYIIFFYLTSVSYGQNLSSYPHRLNIWDYNSTNEYWQIKFNKIKAASIKTQIAIHKHKKHVDTIITKYNTDGTFQNERYEFDSKNRIVLRDQRFVSVTDTLIDTTGFLTKIGYTDTSIFIKLKVYNRGDSSVRYSDHILLYNQKGQLKMDSIYNYVTNDSAASSLYSRTRYSRYLYEYDDIGRVKSLKIVRSFNTGGYRPSYFEYLYDENTVIKRYYRTIRERGRHRNFYGDMSYHYDSLGRIKKKEFRLYDPITKREYNTYDSGHIVFDKYGNDIERMNNKGKLSFTKYTYDDFGNILSEQHFKRVLKIFKKQVGTVNYIYEYY